MQTASADFVAAMAASSGTWAAPVVHADWAGDGSPAVATPWIYDSFTRTTVNEWGTSDGPGNLPWSVSTPADSSVTGGFGIHSVSAIGVRLSTIGGPIGDVDIRVRVGVAALSLGGAVLASLVGRYQDASNYLHFRCDFNTDQNTGWQILKVVAGVQTTLASGLVGLTQKAGTRYWIRAQAIGSALKVKVWADRTTEPSTWTGSVTDSSITAAGQIGVRSSLPVGNTNTVPLALSYDRFFNGDINNIGYAGASMTVSHAFDDGLPSEVSEGNVDALGQLAVPVGDPTNVGNPAQYWSPFNDASPIAPYDRDVAPVTVTHGAVTASGIERVSIFSGRMADVDVTSRDVTLTATAETSRLLRKAVQPPAIRGIYEGAEATWPVAYALSKCGLYVSPPPRTGCRWWSPMHGSFHPMVPDTMSVQKPVTAITNQVLYASAVTAQFLRPTFITGPFLTGAYCELNALRSISANVQAITMAPGADLISQAGNAGRVEFWVRGDVADTVTGVDIVKFGSLSRLVGFKLTNISASSYFEAGVGTDRKVFVTVHDGTRASTLKSSATVPTDGAWYFVGAAWDVANNSLTVDFSGAVATAAPSPAMTTTTLPPADGWVSLGTSGNYNFYSYLPVAEAHLTAGPQANPANYPWINDPAYWTTDQAGVIMRQSRNRNLVAIAETKPRPAAELIADYAQAELAMTRCDERDRFCYLPLSYWGEDEQQATVDTLSTDVNVGDLALKVDVTRVRNSAVVTWTHTELDSVGVSSVYASASPLTFPPGKTTVTVPLTSPATFIYGIQPAVSPIYNMTAADVTAGGPPLPEWSYVCINSDSAAAGSYATSSQVSALITAWTAGTATIEFTNSTNDTWFLVNNGNALYMELHGNAVLTGDLTTTVTDAASIAKRGELALTVSLPAIQDAEHAQWVTAQIVGRFARPRRRIENVTVRGDPRRQPGDMVQVADPTGTKATGLWRSGGVVHNIDGPAYAQDMTLTQAWLVGRWDQSNWDECIWGP